jgi:hypothetical protein
MVAHGPSGVPSRSGVWPCDGAEPLKRLQIALHNANAYQRRVAAKEAARVAHLMAHPCGPLVFPGVPAIVSRPPVTPAGTSAA